MLAIPDWLGVCAKYMPCGEEAAADLKGQALLKQHSIPVADYRGAVPAMRGRILFMKVIRGASLNQLMQFEGSDLSFMNRLFGKLTETYTVAPTLSVQQKLFGQRVSRGGRLEEFYGVDFCKAEPTLRRTLLDARGKLLSSQPVRAWLSSGDLTVQNVFEPGVLIDFDNAGLNSVAGDMATLLWSISDSDSWIAPLYLCQRRERLVQASFSNGLRPQRVLAPTWGRAARWLLKEAVRPTLGALGVSDSELVPYLVCRMFGLLPLSRFSAVHAAWLMDRLAFLESSDFTLEGFLALGGVTDGA